MKFVNRELDEDTWRIEALSPSGITMGGVVFDTVLGGWEFEFWHEFPQQRMPEYSAIFPDDRFVKISELNVYPEYRNMGVANALMRRAMRQLNTRRYADYQEIFLNACPLDSLGGRRLALPWLTRFYEGFGFRVFMHQGDNNLMVYTKRR